MTLSPEFDSSVQTYTATTTNASNKVTATVAEEQDEVEIKLNGTEIENESYATWVDGSNTLTIKVIEGSNDKTYTVTVTKTTEATE